MTAEQLIRLLLELDQQVISPRPSAWGKAAELVATLAEHAEPSLRDPKALGDWAAVDLSGVRRRAPRDLDQPTLDRIQAEEDASRSAFDAAERAIADCIRRPMGVEPDSVHAARERIAFARAALGPREAS